MPLTLPLWFCQHPDCSQCTDNGYNSPGIPLPVSGGAAEGGGRCKSAKGQVEQGFGPYWRGGPVTASNGRRVGTWSPLQCITRARATGGGRSRHIEVRRRCRRSTAAARSRGWPRSPARPSSTASAPPPTPRTRSPPRAARPRTWAPAPTRWTSPSTTCGCWSQLCSSPLCERQPRRSQAGFDSRPGHSGPAGHRRSQRPAFPFERRAAPGRNPGAADGPFHLRGHNDPWMTLLSPRP